MNEYNIVSKLLSLMHQYTTINVLNSNVHDMGAMIIWKLYILSNIIVVNILAFHNL